MLTLDMHLALNMHLMLILADHPECNQNTETQRQCSRLSRRRTSNIFATKPRTNETAMWLIRQCALAMMMMMVMVMMAVLIKLL